MREDGVILATNITYIANMIICDIWCYSRPSIRRSLVKPSWQAVEEMYQYIQIAVPGACMLIFEWVVFEILAIFSGIISVEALAAEIIIVNIVGFVFMVPLGTSYAASALTGVFLGEMKIQQAKRYSRIVLLFNIIVTTLIIITLGLLHTQISQLFTHDSKTVAIIDDVLYILFVYIFFDSIHGV
jgi:MATE family multidrug resistance protein